MNKADYYKLTYEELVKLYNEKDRVAQEFIINKFNEDFKIFRAAILKRYTGIDESDLNEMMFKILVYTINIYDENKGPFINLLRFNESKFVTFYIKREMYNKVKFKELSYDDSIFLFCDSGAEKAPEEHIYKKILLYIGQTYGNQIMIMFYLYIQGEKVSSLARRFKLSAYKIKTTFENVSIDIKQKFNLQQYT